MHSTLPTFTEVSHELLKLSDAFLLAHGMLLDLSLSLSLSLCCCLQSLANSRACSDILASTHVGCATLHVYGKGCLCKVKQARTHLHGNGSLRNGNPHGKDSLCNGNPHSYYQNVTDMQTPHDETVLQK